MVYWYHNTRIKRMIGRGNNRKGEAFAYKVCSILSVYQCKCFAPTIHSPHITKEHVFVAQDSILVIRVFQLLSRNAKVKHAVSLFTIFD
jgi:hypothetical protein